LSLFDDKTYLDPKKCADAVGGVHKDTKDSLVEQRTILWPRYLKHYYGKHDPTQYGSAAGEFDLSTMTFLPFPKQQVDVITAQLRGALSDADPPVRLRSEIGKDDTPDDHHLDDYAGTYQEWINNQLIRQVAYRQQLGPCLKAAGITGTQWMFLEWFSDYGPQYGQTPDPANPSRGRFGRLPHDATQAPSGRIRCTPVSCTDMFPDPMATGVDVRTCSFPMRFAERQLFMPLDSLVRFIEATPRKKWVVNKAAADSDQTIRDYLAKYEGTVGPKDDIWKVTLQEVSRPSGAADSAGRGMYRRVVRLVDHWEPDRHVLLIMQGEATGEALLIEGPDSHPYRLLGIPFRPLRLMVMPGEVWGGGLIAPISDLCHQANVWFNLRNMHLAKLAGPIILTSTRGGLYREDLTNYIGMPIEVMGAIPLAQCIHMVAYPDTTKELVREIEWLNQQIQITAGATDYALGTAMKGFNETVRGMAMIGEQLNTRKGDMISQLVEDVACLVQGMIALNQQYMTEPAGFAITGRDGKSSILAVTREMLEREYQITIDTRPIAANRAMRVQQHINAAQMFSQTPSYNLEHAIVALYQAMDDPHPQAYVKKVVDSPDNPDAENRFHEATGRGDMPPARSWHNHANHIASHDTWIKANDADPVMAGHLEQHFVFAGYAEPQAQPPPVQLPENNMLPGNQQRYGPPEQMQAPQTEPMEPL